MKTEYVVVAEQAPPLGPAYSIIPTSLFINNIMKVTHRIIVLCHNLLSLLHIYCPSFSGFWCCHSYILQHFNENFFIRKA